jgi:hypothetical protein
MSGTRFGTVGQLRLAEMVLIGMMTSSGLSATIGVLAAAVVAALIVAAAPLGARQDRSFDSVFRSGVEVVRGRITVNGRNGRPPKDLVPDDVEILQNGVRQTITVFERFVLNPSQTCYEIGFSSSTPAFVKKRTIEVKVRGYSKRLKSTYAIKDESDAQPRSDTSKRKSSCL